MRHLCMIHSESDYDMFLFTLDCFGFIAQTVFKVRKYFIEYFFGFTVPEIVPMYVIYCRFEV